MPRALGPVAGALLRFTEWASAPGSTSVVVLGEDLAGVAPVLVFLCDSCWVNCSVLAGHSCGAARSPSEMLRAGRSTLSYGNQPGGTPVRQPGRPSADMHGRFCWLVLAERRTTSRQFGTRAAGPLGALLHPGGP